MSRTQPQAGGPIWSGGMADAPALIEISPASGVAIIEVLPPATAVPALIEIFTDGEPALDVVVPASAPAVLEVSGSLAVEIFLPLDAPVSIDVLAPAAALTTLEITEFAGPPGP